MMMTTRPITGALAGFDVIHFAISTSSSATWALAVILRATLGGRSSESPNVIALPFATALV